MKKILALLVATCMLVTLSSYVFAANAPNLMSDNSSDSGIPPNLDKYDIPVKIVDHAPVREVPQQDVTNLSEQNAITSNLSTAVPAISISDDPSFRLNSATTFELGDALTQSFSGVISNGGGMQYINVTLQPTQSVQASLACPLNESLDYDLYVFEFGPDGNLISQPVASSEYTTRFNTLPDGTRKTVDEGVGYVNNSSTTKIYAVIVMARIGFSATDNFVLTISLDHTGNLDAAEPNDSAFHPYGITDGTTTGTNLNASNDQDWFVWNVPSGVDRARITASLDNSKDQYAVSLYTADGTKMLLRNKSNEHYSVQAGYFYICVTANSGSFRASNYTLEVNAFGSVPATMEVVLNGDEGPNSYPPYPQGTRFRAENWIQPEVYLKNASGYPVEGRRVDLYWESGSWIPESGNHSRTDSAVTDKNGCAKPRIDMPVSLGYYRVTVIFNPTWEHRYDIDGLAITVPGTDLSHAEVFYHFMLAQLV